MYTAQIHPVSPQPRLISKVVDILRAGGIIAYPTDSGYALGCMLGNKSGQDRIKAIRQLSDKHDYTLVLSNFAQLGQYVIIDNAAFRLIKRLTPGPYTFILKGTKEVPRLTLNQKKHTVGARIPKSKIIAALLDELGEPLVSSTLIMPGQSEPLSEGWQVADLLGSQLDALIDAPVESTEPTTVLVLTDDEVQVRREGAGPLDF